MKTQLTKSVKLSSCKMSTFVFRYSTVLAALLPTATFSQEAATTSSTVLETIVVQGSGPAGALDTSNDSKSIVATQSTATGKMPTDILSAPASVSVVTSKEIQERGADSLEKVVQYSAGVNTNYYGGDDRYDYVDVRGFTPYTYRDGLAVGRTFGGVKEEPYAFERIEVLKGTSSAGFGAAEPGGAINYVTKLPKADRFGEAYVTTGTYAHKEVGLDFGDKIDEEGDFSYRFTGKFQNADAEYDYSKDNEKFIMGGLTWSPTDYTNLSFVFDHLDRDGVPGSGGQPLGSNFERSRFFGEPDYYFLTTNRNTYSVMFDHDFANGLTFGSKARYLKANNAFGSAYLASPSTTVPDTSNRYFFGSDTSTEQFVIDAHLIYEANLADTESRTLAGVDYNNFKSTNYGLYLGAPPISSSNPVYSGGPSSTAPNYGSANDQKTTGIYLQQDLTFFDKLTLSFGLRNDWFDLGEDDLFSTASSSDQQHKFTKRVGASYKITDELAIYTSYGESAAPPGIGTDPTTGKQVEAGIKYRPEAFPALFTASIYDLTKGNITVFDSVTYIPSSVDKVRHRGLELEAKAEVTDNVSLIAAYSYIDSKIEEPGGANDGNRLMRVPKNMVSLWATYTLPGEGPRGDMTFSVGGRYQGSYFLNLANTGSSEKGFVFDAAYTYKIFENTALQLNASNIFNEKHIASQDSGGVYYNSGRTVMATLRQTW